MNESAVQPEAARASTTLKVAVAVLLPLSILQSGLSSLKTSQNVAQLAGAASLPVIIALVVLGVAKLFGRARTGRSQALILMWTLLGYIALSCMAELGH